MSVRSLVVGFLVSDLEEEAHALCCEEMTGLA
jgi:hypothetical protein